MHVVIIVVSTIAPAITLLDNATFPGMFGVLVPLRRLASGAALPLFVCLLLRPAPLLQRLCGLLRRLPGVGVVQDVAAVVPKPLLDLDEVEVDPCSQLDELQRAPLRLGVPPPGDVVRQYDLLRLVLCS